MEMASRLRCWSILCAAAITLSPASARSGGLSPAATLAIEAMLECERPAGGWMYVCPPQSGSHGVTKVVNLGARLADTLNFEPWEVVVLRSPGTPAAGLFLLEAWEISGEPRYLEAARRSGDLLVELQLPSGGWFSEMPVRGSELAAWFRWYAPWATLDDDVTTGTTRLLLRLFEVTGEDRYRRSAIRALDLLLEAQLPSGAWPLTHRPTWIRAVSPSFEDLPSLNDGATASVIETLILGAEVLDRPDLLAAAVRGGDWLVASRFPAPMPGWAQQYDESGRPVPGRRFEPVALATWESRLALDALLSLERAVGDGRYCEAVQEGLDWLEGAAISPGCWPRYLSLEAGTPVYLDFDGRPVDNPTQAKRPYRWTGDYGIPDLLFRAGRAFPPEMVTPRIPGDAGDCPGTPRRIRSRIESRNPRARIGASGTRLAAQRASAEVPCARFAITARAVPSKLSPSAGQEPSAP
jgi:hypothetical protein